MNKRLFKILCFIENVFATLMIVVGSLMYIGQSGNLKADIVMNLLGLGMLIFGLWDINE